MQSTLGFCIQNLLSSENLRCEEFKGKFNDSNIYYEAGVVTLSHIVSPFAFSVAIFVVLCCTKVFEFNWSLSLKFPIPPLTKLSKCINECKHYINNTRKDSETFEEEKKILMQEMETQEMPTNLSMIIEASLESSFQFFYQSLYFMPTLIVAVLNILNGGQNLTNLVDWKILSIVLSFITFSLTSFRIR